MKRSNTEIVSFQEAIWKFYTNYGRDFAWRNIDDPYRIMVSEIMLQQTQTSRVIKKFEQFVTEFPTFCVLAKTTLRHALSMWQGLGYNRRAKYLLEIAQWVITENNGIFPSRTEELIKLPGIGKATAASICAFAFNKPTVFIETNIRTVFIHFFFKNEEKVHDNDILPLVAQTLDFENSREWYYALMDYGVMLKQRPDVSNRKSAHYHKQSRFIGSDRQIRGRIVQILIKQKSIQLYDLVDLLVQNRARVERIVADLCRDGLVLFKEKVVSIR